MCISTLKRGYEIGVACARADKALGNPAIQIDQDTMCDGGYHKDKRACGPAFVAGYNVQVLRNLGISTRATYRTIVKETEKFWRT